VLEGHATRDETGPDYQNGQGWKILLDGAAVDQRRRRTFASSFLEMSVANPLWGAPRIHGELLKLGIDVGQTSKIHGQEKAAAVGPNDRGIP
jgi:hypothetical protein